MKESIVTQAKNQLYSHLLAARRDAVRATSADEKETIDLIRFVLLNESYGIELEKLQEILKPENIVKVPGSRDHLLGIINLRGNFLTVVDLRKRFGQPGHPLTRSSRIIVIEHRNRSMGLMVDKIEEILPLNRTSLAPPPTTLSDARRRFVKAVGKTRDQVISILDLPEVLTVGKS